MNDIIISIFVLIILTCSSYIANADTYITGTDKETIREEHLRAIDAANTTLNSHESNAPAIPESYRAYKHQDNIRVPPIQAHPAPKTTGTLLPIQPIAPSPIFTQPTLPPINLSQ